MKKALLLLTTCLMALSSAFAGVTYYLNENFESGQIPSGWTQEVISENVANWVIEPTSAATYPATGNTSNYYVALRNTTGMDQHYVTKLVSPTIDFASVTDLNQPQLIFRHAQVGAGEYFDTLKVYARTSPTSPWSLLKVFNKRYDQWTTDTVALTGFSSAQAYQLGFEAVENMGRGIVVDDIRITNTSTCVAPSNVAMSIPGTTSVTLAWAGALDTDTFEIVLTTTAVVDWDNYDAVYQGYATDFHKVITGLTSSTTYFAYVRAKCYDNETGWTDWAMGTFRTRARIEIPYTENFSSALPEGWVSYTDMTSTKPSFSSATAAASSLASYSVDSTFAMQFGAITAGKYACAITPEVNVASLQGVEVGFWGYAATYMKTPVNSYIAQMYVGVVNDPEDTASLVIVDSVEIKVANKHQHFSVSLAGYQGTGKYLVFLVSDPKRTAYFYVDHLTVDVPSVFTPTDVQITNAGPDGFDVSVNLHGATKWNLRVADASNYKHMNVIPSAFLLSQDNLSGNTYHVTGDFGDVNIAVYAQAVSGTNTSAWSFPTTLRIPSRATLPIQYEFASADATLFVKSLDNEIHVSNTNKTFPGLYFPMLDLANFYPKSQTTAPTYESGHMVLQGVDQWVALPYVDSFTGQMVSFRLACGSTEGQSRVAVGIMKDAYDLKTFTQLAVFEGPKSAYTKCEVDLDGLDSLGHYVAIVAMRPKNPGTYGSVNHIDALHVEAMPTCREALEVEANVADTTISLTWKDRGMNHWLVELFHGTKQDSLLRSLDVTSPAATIGGLTTLTDYYYRVSTICDNDTLPGMGKVKFTTKCDLVSTFPWEENFNDMTTGNLSLSCWENEHTAGSATTKFSVTTTTYGDNATKKLYTASMAAGNVARLSLPEMVFPNANYEFLISVWRNSTNATKVNEGLRILASDGNSETELAFIPRVVSAAGLNAPAEDADGWYTYELPLGISGLCRVIVQAEGEGGGAIYMDDFKVRQIPTCQSVKELTISNVTASSARVAWTARGNESQWQYVMTVPGQAIDWANAVTVGTPSASLTGLSGSTSYEIHVRAYCSASDQSEVVTRAFQTSCGPIAAVPWGEGFEAFEVGTYDSPAPNCWAILNANTGTSSTYPQVYVNNSATYVKTGSKSLYFKSSSTTYAYAIFPAIGMPLNTLRITFSHREENANYSGMVGVGYMTDPTDASTFVLLAEYTRLAGWQDEELILSGVPAAVANTARLAFRYGGGPNNNYFVGIDDIMLQEVDFSCPGLTDISATSGTPNSITINWTAAQMLPTDVEISDSANFAVVRTFPALEGGTLTLDSLEQNHYYYVRGRQVCDAGGEWKSTVVKTLCDAVDPATYPMQDFELATDLDCWLVGVSVPGKQVTADPTIGTLAARGKYLYFNKAATTSDTITKGDGLYAIMPMMDVDSIRKYEVAFKAFKTSTTANNAGNLAVGIITDPTDFSTFTLIKTLKLEYAADSLAEKQYTINFLNYTGDYNEDYGKYIMFLAQSGDSANQIGVDKLVIRRAATCPQIAEGVISNITNEGATYSWESTGAPAYEVVVLTEQVDPDLAEIEPVFVDTVSTDSIVITGISAARVYFAYVRALCSATDASRWSTYSRFRTLCGKATIPYAEGFNDDESLNCFGGGNMQSTSSTYKPTLNSAAAYQHDGTQVLRLEAYKYSTTTKADSSYLILPELNYGVKGLRGHTLSLFARSYGSTTSTTDYYYHMKVGVVKGEDMGTFQLISDVELTDSYKPYDISFENYTDTAEGRIAILATVNPTATVTTRYGYIYLDDISVTLTPACKDIASLDAVAGRRTIDVTITPKQNGTPDHYELVYSLTELTATALDRAVKVNVDTTGRYTIKGLDRATQYYVYARANCGEDGTSQWSGISVTTKDLIGCDDYAGVGLDATTTNAIIPMSSNYNYGVYEQIYTAAEIGRAGRIGSIGFYNTGTTKSRRFEVYMIHTTKESFTSTTDWATITAADKVYDGEMEFVSGEWNHVVLDKVFDYNGTQNLLIVVHNYSGSYSSGMSCKTFAGTNQALYKQQDAGDYNPLNMTDAGTRLSVKNQLQVGFCYDLDPCPSITDLSVELLGAGIREAMLRWTAADADYLSGYDVIVCDSAVANPDSVAPTYANVQGDSLLVNTLRPETLYHVYVRANCKAEGHDEGVSNWVDTTFETLANCPAVVNLASELSTAATTVKVTWETAFEDQELHFAYICATDTLSADSLAAAEKTLVNDTLAFEIENLAYDQTYYIYVGSACGNNKFSPWTYTVIKTDATCAPVRNLAISRLEHNRVVLSWNPSRFGSETQWEAGIVGDSASIVYVSDTAETVSAMIIGLEPDSMYTAYVRAICGEGETSVIDTLSFRTNGSFGECVLVGEATTKGNVAPFNNYYKNAWTQTIYTAEEVGGNAGVIGSLMYNCGAVATTSLTQSVNIYLAHTTMALSSATTDWVPQADLVLVYTNAAFTHPTETGWIEIPLDNPFTYNGTDNLAVVVSTHATEYATAQHYAYTAGTSGVTMYRRSDTDATCGDYPGTAAGTKSTNKPNVQFCFAAASGCAAVTALKVEDVTTTTAVASWEPMSSERAWKVVVADTVLSDFTGYRIDTAYHYVYPMTGLQPDKDYWFYVQPICDSDWKAYKFTTVATCSAPIELDVKDITFESAKVTWNDAFSVGLSYEVAYGKTNTFNLNDTTTFETVTVQTAYAVLSGLDDVTGYSVAVRANCDAGEISRFSEVVTFETKCAMKQMPWSDGFEGSVSCWRVGNRQSSTSTYIPSIVSTATYVHEGGKAMKMYVVKTSSTNADSAYVLVPEVDFGEAGIQGATLRFFARSYGTSTSSASYYKHVKVGVITNSIRTFQLVKDIEITDTYDEYEVSFANYTGNGERIVILATVDPTSTLSSRYCYVYFDDVTVMETPACARPASVALREAAADSATFAWVPGVSGTQWQYVCGMNGVAPDWSNATVTDTTVATVHGLTSGATTYQFFVRTYCSATEQSEARSALVTTDCGLITALPWNEGFETYQAGTYSTTTAAVIPPCWTMSKTASANGLPHVAANGSYAYPHSGNNVLVTYALDTSYAVLPEFAMPLNTLQIKFYYRTYNATSSGDLVLGYISSVDSSFNAIRTFGQIATMKKEKVLLTDLPATAARLAFMYTGGQYAYYNVNIDDISVDILDPNCAGVDNVRASDISLSGATVKWSYSLGNQDAQVQIASDATFETIVDSATVMNDSAYVVTGLQSGTPYYIRVRQLCDDDEFSEWSDATSFTTNYGVPFAPQFNSTTVPADWMRSNTTATQVFGGQEMATETAGWAIIAADTIIDSYHFRGNIYGTTWHHWVVTPTIDLTPNVGDGLILSFDAALTPFGTGTTYDNNRAKMYTGVDDRFLVAVSTDGGETWNAANVTEWNNTETGQYVYNDVPMVGTRYMINMSDYAGNNVKIGFYGESSVSNADNYFQFGNITLKTVETVTLVDTICEGYSFDKNGFNIPYDQLHVGLNAVSRYETDSTGAMTLTIQQILVNPTSLLEIPVELCEGEHYNGYGFDVTVTKSESIRKRIDGGNQFGCDSTAILQITMLPTIREELHVGCNADSYTWHGKTYYQSTIVSDTTSSAVTGCDSITTLYLTMCDGITYNYHGAFCGGSYSDEFFENLTAPGQYSTTTTSEIGCETHANLTLHQLQPGQDYIDTVYVEDLPYVLGNDTLCTENDFEGVVYHGSKDFGCGVVNVTVVVARKNALDNVAAGKLQVAPNPVAIGEDIRILTDITNLSDYSCRVFDAVGKLVYESFEPSKTIPGLPVAGMYTVRISSGSAIYQGKLIVR